MTDRPFNQRDVETGELMRVLTAREAWQGAAGISLRRNDCHAFDGWYTTEMVLDAEQALGFAGELIAALGLDELVPLVCQIREWEHAVCEGVI